MTIARFAFSCGLMAGLVCDFVAGLMESASAAEQISEAASKATAVVLIFPPMEFREPCGSIARHIGGMAPRAFHGRRHRPSAGARHALSVRALTFSSHVSQ